MPSDLAIVTADTRSIATPATLSFDYSENKTNYRMKAHVALPFGMAHMLSAWTKALYAERHGFTFHQLHAQKGDAEFAPFFARPAGTLHGTWLKPLALRYALERHEWALWLDSDVCVVRLALGLEPLLAQMRRYNRSLAMSPRTSEGHNGGLLLMRSTPAAFALLRDWWAARQEPLWSRYDQLPFQDQSVLNEAVLSRPRHRAVLMVSNLLGLSPAHMGNRSVERFVPRRAADDEAAAPAADTTRGARHRVREARGRLLEVRTPRAPPAPISFQYVRQSYKAGAYLQRLHDDVERRRHEDVGGATAWPPALQRDFAISRAIFAHFSTGRSKNHLRQITSKIKGSEGSSVRWVTQEAPLRQMSTASLVQQAMKTALAESGYEHGASQ